MGRLDVAHASACWYECVPVFASDTALKSSLLPSLSHAAAAEFPAEMPFVIKKNPIEKGALGSRPAEITFFKQAAVE